MQTGIWSKQRLSGADSIAKWILQSRWHSGFVVEPKGPTHDLKYSPITNMYNDGDMAGYLEMIPILLTETKWLVIVDFDTKNLRPYRHQYC